MTEIPMPSREVAPFDLLRIGDTEHAVKAVT